MERVQEKLQHKDVAVEAVRYYELGAQKRILRGWKEAIYVQRQEELLEQVAEELYVKK